jgi:hypothetical protein
MVVSSFPSKFRSLDAKNVPERAQLDLTCPAGRSLRGPEATTCLHIGFGLHGRVLLSFNIPLRKRRPKELSLSRAFCPGCPTKGALLRIGLLRKWVFTLHRVVVPSLGNAQTRWKLARGCVDSGLPGLQS